MTAVIIRMLVGTPTRNRAVVLTPLDGKRPRSVPAEAYEGRPGEFPGGAGPNATVANPTTLGLGPMDV